MLFVTLLHLFTLWTQAWLYWNLYWWPSLGSMDPGATAMHTMSLVGCCTTSTATHTSRPLIVPSKAQSQQVSPTSQHSAYWSYLDASDEEIMEELARRHWHHEGEAPGEFPQPSLTPVCSWSDLGVHAMPLASMAQPAAALGHVASWTNAFPAHIAILSPSRSLPRPSLAHSILSEVSASSSSPMAYLAATPDHPGSWASHTDAHRGMHSPLPSPPLSAPAHISHALPFAGSQTLQDYIGSPVSIPPRCTSQHVPLVSPPSFTSPPDVKQELPDHQEVFLTPLHSRHVPQDITSELSYVPLPEMPHSTFVPADIPWDNSSSILNRTNSSLSIQVQCDSDTKSESSSHGLSNFDNDLRAAIATLSLPQQPGESDVAFSWCQDAHACLTLGGPLFQDVVPSPITNVRVFLCILLISTGGRLWIYLWMTVQQTVVLSSALSLLLLSMNSSPLFMNLRGSLLEVQWKQNSNQLEHRHLFNLKKVCHWRSWNLLHCLKGSLHIDRLLQHKTSKIITSGFHRKIRWRQNHS